MCPLSMSRRFQFWAFKVVKNSIWGQRKLGFALSEVFWNTQTLNVCSLAPMEEMIQVLFPSSSYTLLHLAFDRSQKYFFLSRDIDNQRHSQSGPLLRLFSGLHCFHLHKLGIYYFITSACIFLTSDTVQCRALNTSQFLYWKVDYDGFNRSMLLLSVPVPILLVC